MTSGSLEMVVGDMHHVLVAGDAIQFEADVRHEYRNAGTAETVIYLVHKSTVYRLVSRKELPAFKVCHDWRFDMDLIDEWRSAQEQRARRRYDLYRKTDLNPD